MARIITRIIRTWQWQALKATEADGIDQDKVVQTTSDVSTFRSLAFIGLADT